MGLQWADEDVAWEEGLEVDEAVGVRSCQEDLERHSSAGFIL